MKLEYEFRVNSFLHFEMCQHQVLISGNPVSPHQQQLTYPPQHHTTLQRKHYAASFLNPQVKMKWNTKLISSKFDANNRGHREFLLEPAGIFFWYSDQAPLISLGADWWYWCIWISCYGALDTFKLSEGMLARNLQIRRASPSPIREVHFAPVLWSLNGATFIWSMLLTKPTLSISNGHEPPVFVTSWLLLTRSWPTIH